MASVQMAAGSSEFTDGSVAVGVGPLVRPRRQTVIAYAGLGIVLAALTVYALWVVADTRRAATSMSLSMELTNIYDHLKFDIATEESLERKYRLEPSQQVRADYQAAANSVSADIQRLLHSGEPEGRQLALEVESANDRYVAVISDMFAAVDAGDDALVTEIDAKQDDPLFHHMLNLVNDAEDRHDVALDSEAARLDKLTNLYVWATPAVLASGFVLLAACWILLRRYQRLVEASRKREAEQELEHVRRAAEAEQEAIRKSEERFQAIVQNASDMIVIFDAAGRLIFHTAPAEALWGGEPERLNRADIMGSVHGEDRDRFVKVFEADSLGPGRTRNAELRFRTPLGEWRDFEVVVINLLDDPSVGGLVTTLRDITERKEFERELADMAFHDALTGLPNRKLLEDRLEQAIFAGRRDERPVALLIMDLNGFKEVNETFGHHNGDSVLRQIGQRLRTVVRESDTIARFGGDEFAIVLPSCSEGEDSDIVANKVLRALQEPILVDDQALEIEASIGFAFYPAHGDDPQTLIRRADTAMYRAKQGHEGYAVYSPDLDQEAPGRLALAAELRRAIDHDELRLFYQPKVQLSTQKVIGAEALVRWQHPERGIISPDEFIPLAEHTGLIKPLTHWVLRTAIHQSCKWHEEGLPICLAVNLSMRNLQDPKLTDAIRSLLSGQNFTAGHLKAEITESMIMGKLPETIASLHVLSSMGIGLSIDDFGTGYSSLAYLKRLPVQELKIDKSFVGDVLTNENDLMIVRSTIELAHNLGLTVVAEGIESREVCDLLSALGCDIGQGYYIGHPMPDTEFGRWVTESDWAINRVPVAAG